jgi:hypothetical protein
VKAIKQITATALSTVLLAVAVIGCTSSPEPSPPAISGTDSTPQSRDFDSADLFKFLKATRDDRFGGDDDWIITLPDGATCDVSSNILRTASEVAVYRDAGDPVATNRDETMGIKTGSTEGANASCVEELNKRLADFN